MALTLRAQFDGLRHRAIHASAAVNIALIRGVFYRMHGRSVDIPVREIDIIRSRYEKLIKEDVANINAGLYESTKLSDFVRKDNIRNFSLILREVMKNAKRAKAKQYDEVAQQHDMSIYPAYYRRNFHWQTDGYISDYSAQVYDLGVEFLFGGGANLMRKQIIPFVLDSVAQSGNSNVLDIGAGTGSVYNSFENHNVDFIACDLSHAYLKHCNRHPSTKFRIVSNGEHLPLTSDSQETIVSVFLFHELPKQARRNIAKEMFRVCKNGGTIIVQDSIQMTDSPELAMTMQAFPKQFHEPYYKGYVRDDLEEIFQEAGFTRVTAQTAFLSKIIVMKK